MSPHLEAIVALQRSRRELLDAERLLGGIPDWMRSLHEEHSERRAEIDSLGQAAEEALRERRLREAAIADAQEKLKHYQQQISLVRTQREYGALLQEIDTVKAQIRTTEEEVLAAMERAEDAGRQLAERQEAFRSLDERYATELARWEAEKPSLAAKVEELKGKIEGIKEGVPRPVLAQFDRIFERHRGEALAPVKRAERPGGGPSLWHCGFCNFQVRPQVAMEIRSLGVLRECESCKKILFFEGVS